MKKEEAPKRGASRRRTSEPKPVPLDEWEQYVHDFLKDYDCTTEQTNSALSILGELKERAGAHRAATQSRLESAEAIKDRRMRQKRIDEINAPIDRLFNQLKRRLEGLLTSQQRAIKRAKEASKPSRRTRRR